VASVWEGFPVSNRCDEEGQVNQAKIGSTAVCLESWGVPGTVCALSECWLWVNGLVEKSWGGHPVARSYAPPALSLAALAEQQACPPNASHFAEFGEKSAGKPFSNELDRAKPRQVDQAAWGLLPRKQ